VSKRTWRWVTWDGTRFDGVPRHVCIWPDRRKPQWIDGEWIQHGDLVLVCFAEFQRLFGFTPSKDEPIKVEFSARKVTS